MLHTALHRALGERPGPITEQMIDDAIAQGIEESEELDWKSSLPSQKDFRGSDIVKDIAAFANAGGGVLVFGVKEENKSATHRQDAGELTEGYERTIQQACMSAITPPVFGVQAVQIASAGDKRAVAIVVPASPDGPHLIYRGESFGAPLRVGSDTHWMREQQIEAAYRSRFEGTRRSEEAMQRIYDDMAAAAGAEFGFVSLVGVARPRTLRPLAVRRDRVTVPLLAGHATLLARWWMTGTSGNYGPLEDLDIYSPRPTLAGQYLPPATPGGRREAHAAVFDDGSIGLSWSAGAQLNEASGKPYASHQVPTIAVEAFAAGLISLVHGVAADSSPGDYEIILGVTRGSDAAPPVEFHTRGAAPPAGVHRTISGQFRPVRLTVDPSLNDTEFIQAAIDLSTAALNQVGIEAPTTLSTMLPRRPNWQT